MWDYDGKHYLDFSSQLVNVNIGHQHPAVVAAIKAQADIMTTVAPAHANIQRGEAASRILGKAGRHFQGLLHQRRCGCERERHPDGAARHRPRQGPLDLPLVPRQHRRGDRRHRRLAPGAQRVRARSRALLRPVRLPHRVLVAETVEQECERALRHLERVILSEGRKTVSPRSCSRPSPAPRACSCRRPATSRGARALRQVRHPADPRRGHVRLRPHRRVVRLVRCGSTSSPTSSRSRRASTPATCRPAA